MEQAYGKWYLHQVLLFSVYAIAQNAIQSNLAVNFSLLDLPISARQVWLFCLAGEGGRGEYLYYIYKI